MNIAVFDSQLLLSFVGCCSWYKAVSVSFPPSEIDAETDCWLSFIWPSERRAKSRETLYDTSIIKGYVGIKLLQAFPHLYLKVTSARAANYLVVLSQVVFRSVGLQWVSWKKDNAVQLENKQPYKNKSDRVQTSDAFWRSARVLVSELSF